MVRHRCRKYRNAQQFHPRTVLCSSTVRPSAWGNSRPQALSSSVSASVPATTELQAVLILRDGLHQYVFRPTYVQPMWECMAMACHLDGTLVSPLPNVPKAPDTRLRRNVMETFRLIVSVIRVAMRSVIFTAWTSTGPDRYCDPGRIYPDHHHSGCIHPNALGVVLRNRGRLMRRLR
ncbi:hypothetical protein EX30DRAFT_158619 [Ascodesmis nigricans]|uniref:Uncharacterized protein n=1 Tax=Ascodesmis nigricans TaxID=341454 RepID=A0A4S2MMH9_9PEZI|nr:hypothetical protein EX30DRAFT_158619 [Ascodesmis nigricans]